MANSSIASLEFLNYKIGDLHLNMKPIWGYLWHKPTPADEEWVAFNRFSTTYYHEESDSYMVTFGLRLALKRILGRDPLPEGEFFVDAQGDITGLFRFNKETEHPKQTQENLIRFNGPAILAPYLRAALSSLLAQSGYGHVISPLLNIYQAAQDANMPIEKMAFAAGDDATDESRSKD